MKSDSYADDYPIKFVATNALSQKVIPIEGVGRRVFLKMSLL